MHNSASKPIPVTLTTCNIKYISINISTKLSDLFVIFFLMHMPYACAGVMCTIVKALSWPFLDSTFTKSTVVSHNRPCHNHTYKCNTCSKKSDLNDQIPGSWATASPTAGGRGALVRVSHHLHSIFPTPSSSCPGTFWHIQQIGHWSPCSGSFLKKSSCGPWAPPPFRGY